MELKEARKKAEEIVEALRPSSDRIEIAGSIRRGQPFPHDIDLVAIPSRQGPFLVALQKFAAGGHIKGKDKVLQIELNTAIFSYKVDVYIATPENWTTIYLIRTGSAGHNKMLCYRASQMGMKLHADGRGLVRITNDGEVPIPCATETDIFKALSLPYKQPSDREVGR